MFGLGFGEMIIVAIVLLVVVGPRELPKLLKTVGSGIKKLRGLSSDLREQSGIDDIIQDEGLREDLDAIRSLSRGRVVDTLVQQASRPARRAAGRKRVVATAELTMPQGMPPYSIDEYPPFGPDAYDCIPDDANEATIKAAREEHAKKMAEAEAAAAAKAAAPAAAAQPTPTYAKEPDHANVLPAVAPKRTDAEPADAEPADAKPAAPKPPDARTAAPPKPKRALPSVPPKPPLPRRTPPPAPKPTPATDDEPEAAAESTP